MSREEMTVYLDTVAALRITVFSEFPYLYDGDMDYERRYLSSYLESENAIIVGAWAGPQLVGVSTGTPMEDHAEDFADALKNAGVGISRTFYCAESVLLPEYRGQGIGARFFDEREAHALAIGRTWSAFCSVIRPDDHPERPADYAPLDKFWKRRGYRPMPGCIAKFAWKDHEDTRETVKSLQFWIRNLRTPTP
ncbi:MAG: GNAT family N-acetyltransferase [Pseudomonadota bacterium]